MWVFCCGMRRSGSTLQFQLAARIAEEEGLGKRVEWVRPEDFPRVREKYEDYRGLKVFKSHIYTPAMGAEFAQQNATGVYIYRDLRDAFLSQKSKNKVSFGVVWVQDFVESAMKNYSEWTRLPGMLVSKYEHVMRDLPTEVRRIAAHLGVHYDEAKSQSIAEEYTLERQKERIARAAEGQVQQYHNSAFDSQELLHLNHIYSGESGRWKSELTSWQTALIEQKAGEWLVERGYVLDSGSLRRGDRARIWTMNLAARMVKTVYYGNKVR